MTKNNKISPVEREDFTEAQLKAMDQMCGKFLKHKNAVKFAQTDFAQFIMITLQAMHERMEPLKNAHDTFNTLNITLKKGDSLLTNLRNANLELAAAWKEKSDDDFSALLIKIYNNEFKELNDHMNFRTKNNLEYIPEINYPEIGALFATSALFLATHRNNFSNKLDKKTEELYDAAIKNIDSTIEVITTDEKIYINLKESIKNQQKEFSNYKEFLKNAQKAIVEASKKSNSPKFFDKNQSTNNNSNEQPTNRSCCAIM